MRVLFLTNNAVSAPLSEWLKTRREVRDVIVREEPLRTVDMAEIQPHVVISYSYQYIIKADVLDMLQRRFINLHISFLPHNRGADPNAWSFLENTPKGVSIHEIDEGTDTGPILVQKELTFDEERETLGNAYWTLQSEIQALFREHWEELRTGSIRRSPQVGVGSHHFVQDFQQIRDYLLCEDGWNVSIPILKERYARLGDGRRPRP
jgi:methionyl-tRNA formyltransferase